MPHALRLRARFLMGSIVVAVFAAACADTVQPLTRGPRAGVGAEQSEFTTGSVVTVCKVTGIPDRAYTFTATASGGTGWYMPPMPRTLVASLTAISDVSCKDFWLAEDPASSPTQVTVTEVDAMPDSIIVNPFAVDRRKLTGTNAATVTVDYRQGALIKVYNPTSAPPSSGVEGCSLGYWKQPQHAGNWVGYARGGSYDAAFGVKLFGPATTLLEALQLGGGGKNRLARQSTAALLNTTRLGSSFGLTTAQVIAAVRQAVASGKYDVASDLFERLNEQKCPLGRAP